MKANNKDSLGRRKMVLDGSFNMQEERTGIGKDHDADSQKNVACIKQYY